MELRVVVGDHPHTKPLLDGTVKLPSLDVHFEDPTAPMPGYFRKMIRERAYDVCEMGITTYFAAREYDQEFTALPVFPSYSYPFGNIVVNTDASISSPADLSARKIGARTHTVTTVVWARGFLKEMYGFDPDSVTWVINDYEHTKEFTWPANVELREGADISALIESGELAAGINIYRGSAANVQPLFRDVPTVEREAYEKTGINPVNHALVVRNEVLESAPDAVAELYAGFVEAKQAFLTGLDSGGALEGEAADLARRRAFVGSDPIPYGIEAARHDLEAILRFSREQAVITKPLGISELFWEPSA